MTYRRLQSNETDAVVGKRVIVSAGALGSTELLLRCRDVHRTLRNLGSTLGRHFSGNGDFILAATQHTPRAIDPGVGPSITAGVDFSAADQTITVQDLGFPDPLLWYLEGALPNLDRTISALTFIKTYILRSLGLGRTGPLGGMAPEFFEGGFTTHLLPYLGIGSDAANGRMRLRKGHLDIVWNVRQSRQMFARMEQALQALSRGISGKYRTSILWTWPFRKLLTAHPLGGCPMGDDPRSSIVKPTGEVWGYDNLYVVDGSVIPTALGVNPSMTIGSLAERTAFWMIHGREMTGDDPQNPLRRVIPNASASSA